MQVTGVKPGGCRTKTGATSDLFAPPPPYPLCVGGHHRFGSPSSAGGLSFNGWLWWWRCVCVGGGPWDRPCPLHFVCASLLCLCGKAPWLKRLGGWGAALQFPSVIFGWLGGLPFDFFCGRSPLSVWQSPLVKEVGWVLPRQMARGKQKKRRARGPHSQVELGCGLGCALAWAVLWQHLTCLPGQHLTCLPPPPPYPLCVGGHHRFVFPSSAGGLSFNGWWIAWKACRRMKSGGPMGECRAVVVHANRSN